MTDKQKTTQQNPQNASAGSSCMEMMQKMKGQQEGASSCVDMMSQFFDPEEIDAEAFIKMMPQMMGSCCGSATETEAASETDTETV